MPDRGTPTEPLARLLNALAYIAGFLREIVRGWRTDAPP